MTFLTLWNNVDQSFIVPVDELVDKLDDLFTNRIEISELRDVLQEADVKLTPSYMVDKELNETEISSRKRWGEKKFVKSILGSNTVEFPVSRFDIPRQHFVSEMIYHEKLSDNIILRFGYTLYQEYHNIYYNTLAYVEIQGNKVYKEPWRGIKRSIYGGVRMVFHGGIYDLQESRYLNEFRHRSYRNWVTRQSKKAMMVKLNGVSYLLSLECSEIEEKSIRWHPREVRDPYNTSGHLYFIRLPARPEDFHFKREMGYYNLDSDRFDFEQLDKTFIPLPRKVFDFWVRKGQLIIQTEEGNLYYSPLDLFSVFWFASYHLKNFPSISFNLPLEGIITIFHLNTLSNLHVFHPGIIGPDIFILKDKLFFGFSERDSHGPFPLEMRVEFIQELVPDDPFDDELLDEDERWIKDHSIRTYVKPTYYLIIDARWKSYFARITRDTFEIRETSWPRYLTLDLDFIIRDLNLDLEQQHVIDPFLETMEDVSSYVI